MKKWIIIAVIALAVVAGVIYLVGPVRAQRSAAAQSKLQTEPASLGNLTATIGATGIVRANQSAQLLWQTSGTVGEVRVKLGDRIEANQLLAVLEQTSLPQQVILAQADLVGAQKALDDLLNSKLQQAQALQAVDDAQQALEDGQNPAVVQANALEAIATAQKAVENAQNQLNWAKSSASKSVLDEANAQVQLAKDELDTAKEDFDPYANRPDDNLTKANLQLKLSAAQQKYDAAVRRWNSMQGTASQTDQAVAEANLQTAQAQLAQAQRDYERVKDGANPADISVLKAQLDDAQREYDRVKNGPSPEDLQAAQARVAAAQATLNQARLTAPFAGSVTTVNSKPGDQVSPGATAIRLDDLSHLLIDVSVSEVDINNIQPGQPVKLTFDAIPGKEYNGIVDQVDPVGTSDQGTVDFTVTVELTDADEAVKTGMTAAVNVIVNQLQDVLLVPNRAVRNKDGKRVVYVMRSGQSQPVEITLGASSDTESQLVAGDIKEGDLIVLNPPLEFSQNGPPPFARGNQ